MGFVDGVIRMVLLTIETNRDCSRNSNDAILIQVSKPHSRPITQISIDHTETRMVSGSEDNTIFIYQIEKTNAFIQLNPIGLINVPLIVTNFAWNPKEVRNNRTINKSVCNFSVNNL